MFCEKCGRELKDEWKVCPKCGEPVIKSDNEEKNIKVIKDNDKNQEIKQSRDENKKKLAIGVGLIVLIVLIAGSVLILKTNKKEILRKVEKQENNQGEKRNKKVKNVDVEQYFDKSGKELKKLGFKKNNSGKYENEDGSIVIEMKDDAVSSISMNSECKSEFHGIKIGDEYEKIEFVFGDTYPLIGADEGGDLYGNIETGTQIYIRTARNKVRTITIDLNCDLSGYEDSDTIFTDYPGLGGTYYDSDTGERLVIAAVDSNFAYTYYSADGSIVDTATDCTGYYNDENELESIWSDDPLKHGIERREGGGFEISSGVGQPWGNFRKISGTNVITAKLEGTYKNGDDSISISNQITDFDNDNIPAGVEIADVYVSYNGGAIINGTLYTQGGVDGVVVIIDGTTGEPRGTLTVEDGEIIVTGSMFDGTFKLME